MFYYAHGPVAGPSDAGAVTQPELSEIQSVDRPVGVVVEVSVSHAAGGGQPNRRPRRRTRR